jgi:hypothetical protein
MTMEKEIGSGNIVEIAYSGSKGTHLQRRYDINQAYREQELRTLRPYPAFGAINIISDSSNSIYNAGTLAFRRRFSRELLVRAAYTYSKSIDESSNTGGTIQYNFPTAQDSRNLRGERGRSDFDIGHSFSASGIYTPGFSRNRFLKDWQLSGTAILYTGPPFTPKLGTFDYNAGGASRPDRIGSGKLETPTVDQWFDRSAFPTVPVGSYRFGTSGRNILDGPGTISINGSVMRKVRITERMGLQLRADALNLPNHPNFNLPENRVDILSGGSVNRVKNNRTLTLGARLEF